ncbi:DoxX family protein [Bradyrhizobium genosp. P]|uniref:DoxX family protein n=1 Tax=Bradyrhizobium genosp. P TaxID=83641 RepID=UPI003CFA7B7B
MEQARTTPSGALRTISDQVNGLIGVLGGIPRDIISLIARLSVGAVFWQSGQTKLEGWHVSSDAVYLFQTEYKLPIIDPWIAAHIGTFCELFFPILLVVGLASRFAALALLGMTLVIEIFVYPDAWPTHGTWAVCFLVVIARGPGIFSLDHLVARKFGRI